MRYSKPSPLCDYSVFIKHILYIYLHFWCNSYHSVLYMYFVQTTSISWFYCQSYKKWPLRLHCKMSVWNVYGAVASGIQNLQSTENTDNCGVVFLLAIEQLWFLFQFKIHFLTLQWFSIQCSKTKTKAIAWFLPTLISKLLYRELSNCCFSIICKPPNSRRKVTHRLSWLPVLKQLMWHIDFNLT